MHTFTFKNWTTVGLDEPFVDLRVVYSVQKTYWTVNIVCWPLGSLRGCFHWGIGIWSNATASCASLETIIPQQLPPLFLLHYYYSSFWLLSQWSDSDSLTLVTSEHLWWESPPVCGLSSRSLLSPVFCPTKVCSPERKISLNNL